MKFFKFKKTHQNCTIVQIQLESKIYAFFYSFIAGPGGRSLIEIQHLSGANIQISKKGIFTPGTRNRIVTITGPQNAISMAQFYIEQRINEEEAKRARQTSLTGIIQ